MKKADAELQDLRHLVALAGLTPTLQGPGRDVVDAMIADLMERVGPAVPKRRAAAVLRLSTQALDEWLRRGRIAAAPLPNGTRTGVDTADLVWTANQIPPGTTRPGRLVDRARRRAEFWRFNEAVTAREGREFAALPFAERVAQLDALYATMNALTSVRLQPRKEAAA
jgi:hypothetical protein